MGIDGELYRLVFLLHILSVVIGFGSIFLNGVWFSIARRRGGSEGQAIVESATFVTRRWAEPFIYAVLVTGILTLVVSDDAWKFDQAWISIAFTLYIVVIGLSHGLLFPSLRRSVSLNAESLARGDATVPAEVVALDRKVAVASAAIDVLVVLLVIDMIWKPGAP